MKNSFLKKIIVVGLMILLVVIIPGTSGNTKIIPDVPNKPLLTRDVLFFDDFNDNTKDYTKWTEAISDGEWWERNQQTEFRLYEGAPRAELIRSKGIPVELQDNSLVVECIMDTFVDNYPDPYFQYVGQPHIQIWDSSDPYGKNIDVRYRRDIDQIFVADSTGTYMSIGSTDEFRFRVVITVYSDKYQVEVGPYTSGWISKSIFSSTFTLELRLWIELAGSNPGYWWMAAFDDVIITSEPGGSNPTKPNRPSGPTNGGTGIEYTYTTYYTDPEGDQVYYKWDWADGTFSDWLGPYDSGDTTSATHSWSYDGSYSIRVKAKDINDDESDWSDPLAVTMPRNRVVTSPFFNFLEQYPILFQLLQRFLNL